MDRKKANVWIIIVFLVLVFILTTFIDLHSFSGIFKVTLVDDQGMEVQSSTMPELIPVKLSERIIVYKQFSLLSISNQANKMSFDVSNRWMEIAHVDPETITLFVYDNKSSNWSEVDLELVNKYAITTVYTTPTITSQAYMITGMKGSAPSTEKFTLTQRSLIVVVLVGLLLVIGYYKPKKTTQAKKRSSAMTTLDAYIKKSLLEGRDDEEIKKTLLASGWDEKSVDEAIHRLRFI